MIFNNDKLPFFLKRMQSMFKKLLQVIFECGKFIPGNMKFNNAKKTTIISGSIIGLFLLLYFLFIVSLQMFIAISAKRIISLEKKGFLSREYGFVWSEINLHHAMQNINKKMTGTATENKSSIKNKKNIRKNIPSISAIRELNSIKQLSNVIQITDRNDFPLAEIKTTHNLIKLKDLDTLLLSTLIFAEDQNFFKRKFAFDGKSLTRAILLSLWRSITHFKIVIPRGTSTIHQQVAKFILLKFNKQGYAFAEKTLARKVIELKLAQALMYHYSKEEILEIYINHCVRSGKGMVGFYDISMGLFGCSPKNLEPYQSLYLARLVKWNKNIPKKIVPYVKSSLQRYASHYSWSRSKTRHIETCLDSITFKKFKQIKTNHNHLVDLANEYWLTSCRKNNMGKDEIKDMDLANPESMIRRKGNLKIQLHIDIRLQKLLEDEVNKRGYGNDTTIYTDLRIGSYGYTFSGDSLPTDSSRIINVLDNDTGYCEPGSKFIVHMNSGDTIITNIRYRRLKNNKIRRSLFYYKRDTVNVNGQYFAYSIMNAKTGNLLAYYSRGKLGSRLQSLLTNKTPNGSAIAKPILFALNFDLGTFDSTSMITDKKEIPDLFDWEREFDIVDNDTIGVIYQKTKDNKGYYVHNHHERFDGYNYLFNHLKMSNNIIAVENIYRLNRELFTPFGIQRENSQPTLDLLNRLGYSELFKPVQGHTNITGPQIYSLIAARVGAAADSSMWDNYSIALGTLELSLYEQMHLFNTFYNNELISMPSKHPSLVIQNILIAGQIIEIQDTITRYNIFSQKSKIKPALLGMHKRLISNGADRLYSFDINISKDHIRNNIYTPQTNLSNYAKSGTTDDVIIPYNKPSDSKDRTNYGLWNATLRINLPRKDFQKILLDDSYISAHKFNVKNKNILKNEIIDITIACIGECNKDKTGDRDGKSLHKFISNKILHSYGISQTNGFYRNYENYLISCTPDSIRFKELIEKSSISSLKLSRIVRKTANKKLCSIEELHFEKRLFRGLGLEKTSYLKMLSFAPYISNNTKEYLVLISRLKKCKTTQNAQIIIEKLSLLAIANEEIRAKIEQAASVLSKDLEFF